MGTAFYCPDFVTVPKDPDVPWNASEPGVYSLLMVHFSSGDPLFRSEEERETAGPQDTRIFDTDSDTVAMIKERITTRVRSVIMEDGGDNSSTTVSCSSSSRETVERVRQVR